MSIRKGKRLTRKKQLAALQILFIRRSPRWPKRLALPVLILLVPLLAAFLGVYLVVQAVYQGLVADLPEVPLVSVRAYPQIVRIFSREGTLLFSTGEASESIYVKYEHISPYIVNAILAIEDKRFYEHPGFDIRAVGRAALNNLTAGRIVQGGSTITQQLVRLLFLNKEVRSYDKKIREMVLAYRLEQVYDKQQILELYLNKLPFGSNVVGVEAASNRFFDKSAADVSLAEAATLAAMPHAPSYYYIPRHQADLLQRRNLVIELMQEQGFISQAQAAAASGQELTFGSNTTSLSAPHFTFLVLDELERVFGTAGLEEGFDVVTSLDPRVQTIAEQVTRSIIDKNYNQRFKADNAALVAVDAKTGEVLALSGSVDFEHSLYGQFNAARAERQPGSTLKPFIYALAFERLGLDPDSLIDDTPTSFNGYQPLNYDRRFHGRISLRAALVNSYNIPAVKLLNRLGVIEVAEKLDQCGLRLAPSAELSLAIGGAATNLLDLTQAYTAFTRSGNCVKPPLWLSVTDRNGKVRYAVKPETLGGSRALATSSVAAVNGILEGTLRNFQETLPIARDPRFNGVKMKTGTSDGPRDAWVIGYTDEVIIGVWVGNHDNTPMRENVLALKVAVPLWKEFMEKYWKLK